VLDGVIRLTDGQEQTARRTSPSSTSSPTPTAHLSPESWLARTSTMLCSCCR